MADWIVLGSAVQIDQVRAHRYPAGAEIGQVPKCLTDEKLIVERLDRECKPPCKVPLAWCRRRDEGVLWPLPIDALKPWVNRGPEKHTGFAAAAVSADHLEEKS